MKSLLVLLLASTAAAFASVLALAQAPDAASTPGPAAVSPTPPPAGSAHEAAAVVPLPGEPAGSPKEKNIPLIPEAAPSAPEASTHGHRAHGGVSPRPTETFAVEQDIRMRVRLRASQTRALNSDPRLDAEWIAAHRAPTDPGRRALLAVYFNHLYDRMAKLDPSIAEQAKTRKQAAIDRMKYTRLGDLDNPEDPFAAPTQEASGPNPPEPEPTAAQ